MNHHHHSYTGGVLPIAPSPIVATAAGQKRKLVVNKTASTSTTAIGNSSNHHVTGIPRRESAPATLAKTGSGGVGGAMSSSSSCAKENAPPVVPKPSEYWKSLLEEWNIPILDTVGIEQDESHNNPDKNVVFLETTSDRVEAYQNIELLTAVRRRDLVTLRRIAAENSTMNACNRFGESILHLACRKGSLDVVELLVGESCNCSLLVRDDYGRTVLHDACWTVSPPWKLLKLILKEAPVLWRVSDVRGHLALQYVPKSAWPQWTAFLTKNKPLLQRIMVHSYHNIDIAHQALPPHLVGPAPHPPLAPAAVQQPPPQQAAEPMVIDQEVSNATTGVPAPTLPQHYQPTKAATAAAAVATTPAAAATVPPRPGQNLPMPLPTPASLPVSTHNSEEQLPAATTTTTTTPQALPTAQQAQNVLARALAQASPAMVQAISSNELRPLKQGLSRFPSPQATAATTTPAAAAAATSVTTTPIPVKQEPVPPPQPVPQPVPGPATAALDEALRAQSANRSKSRSNFLLTEETAESTHQLPHKPAAAQPPAATATAAGPSAPQDPIPYAPSISMIAARLAGYQKNNNSSAIQEEAPDEASTPPNPLPAVPNPLLNRHTSSPNPQQHLPVHSPLPPPKQEQQGVPSSITTTTKNIHNNNNSNNTLVPNPMAETTSSSSASSENGDSANSNTHENSTSSVTMSASPSVVEETNSSEEQNDATTDTDIPSSLTSSSAEELKASSVVAAAPASDEGSTPEPQAAAESGDSDENDEKASPDDAASKKRIVG